MKANTRSIPLAHMPHTTSSPLNVIAGCPFTEAFFLLKTLFARSFSAFSNPSSVRKEREPKICYGFTGALSDPGTLLNI